MVGVYAYKSSLTRERYDGSEDDRPIKFLFQNYRMGNDGQNEVLSLKHVKFFLC